MRIREAFDLDVEQRERAATSRQDDTHNGELVNMYRTLAKQLHPDSAHDASADSLAVWHRVQQAYAAKNVSQMKSLLSMMGAEDVLRSEATEWDLERWQLEVERLETRLRVEHRKLRKLRSEEPFTMEHVIDDEQWQIRHRRELEQAIASKQHEIRENTSRYTELTGGSVPPGTELVKTKDEQSFEEDFLKNTYFGRR
jgi:DnaJ-class molecular chaperone